MVSHHAIHPVILCGGSGTRLWPMSRKARPKPFLPLIGDQTLFEQAVARVAENDRFAAPVTGPGPTERNHARHAADQQHGLHDPDRRIDLLARIPRLRW